MKRTTEINIDGSWVEVVYSINEGEIISLTAVIDGHKSEANWILNIPSTYENLLAHNHNMALEENANED